MLQAIFKFPAIVCYTKILPAWQVMLIKLLFYFLIDNKNLLLPKIVYYTSLINFISIDSKNCSDGKIKASPFK
jgi:hypothetical protein